MHVYKHTHGFFRYFSVSYAVVRKSFERTKSTDDGKQDALEDSVENKCEEPASLEDKSSIKCSRPKEPPSIPLTHRKRCQRIIDKVFGACEYTKHNPELTQTYFSHNIDVEVTKRKIFESEKAKLKLEEQVKLQNPLLPESRTQYCISKITGELIKDENQDEIGISKDSVIKVPLTVKGPTLADREDLLKTLNIHITAAEEPNVTKKSDNGIAEDYSSFLEPYSSNAKEEVEKCTDNPECVKNKTLPDDDAEAIETVKDEGKKYLYEKKIPQEQINTLIPYTKTQFGLLYSMMHEDENQNEVIFIDTALKLPPVIYSELAGMEGFLNNAEKDKRVQNLQSVENKALHDDDSETVEMNKDERKRHMFINATTAKEDEEKLIQKLETIEETPLVEAETPKIEGFNVTQRVLGDQSVLNNKCIENDKGCVPRMPVLPSCEHMTKVSKEADKQSLYSRYLSTSYLWGQRQQNAAASKTRNLQNEEKGETGKIEHSQAPQGQSKQEEVVIHPEITTNRGLVEGIHQYTNTTSNFSLPASESKKTVEGSQEKSYSKEDPQLKPEQGCVKVSLPDELLKEHELDPYCVLACNETCPIAPLSTPSTYNQNDFVDTTETIYMKKNICESVRPKPLPRDLKMASEEKPTETEALHELDVECEPEIIPESYIPTATPNVKSTDAPHRLASLPKLNERMSLSELLCRVRERSRLQSWSDLKALGVKVEPTVGKCNRKAPHCVPTAPRSPPSNPVPPPSFGLPMLKRRPPVCQPPKKKPGCKCTACDIDVSCDGQIGGIFPELAYELNEAEVVAVRSKVDLSEVVVDRLHDLGKAIRGVLHQVKSSTETFFARDYDPWTPIPSWPSPQKNDKKWQPATPCNYRCPIYPKARASMKPDPPCDVKPCQGFPKRSFSMLDYLTVSVDDIQLK